MRLAIYGSRSQDRHLPKLSHLIRTLIDRGHSVSLHPKVGNYLKKNSLLPEGALMDDIVPQNADLAVSIGGDGTFLRASNWVGDREIPMLGINTGHLGFLTICRLDEAANLIADFENGRLPVERRMMLRVECNGLPDDVWPYALNEVAVMKEATSSMITVNTEINGTFLADYRCDGLVVATPTGSTAYSLSAGGPILEPTLRNIIIVPIAPHTLTVRPLVAGGDSVLDFRVACRAESFRLSLDSASFTIPSGERVRISRAGFETRVVRRPDSPFPDVLREKLLWNTDTI